MKKLSLLLLAISIYNLSFAQDECDTPPGHVPFISWGLGWTANSELSYSGEAGIWGMAKATSFALTFDAVVNVENAPGQYTYWLGVKPYITVFTANKLCVMTHIAPKMQLVKEKNVNTLIEIGFDPYYELSDDLLLGFTVGNQSMKGSPVNIFVSGGFVYLFNKH